MRLLERLPSGEIRLTEILHHENIPPYVALSHTWGEEEVTFQDFEKGTEKDRKGFAKIKFCGDEAARQGFRYFWVDTCCINKSNSSEVTEAVNSMFRWYQNAAKCFVYLEDVTAPIMRRGNCPDCGRYHAPTNHRDWGPTFEALKTARWFTRGWTLQELLAPRHVGFFTREGVFCGCKQYLSGLIADVTGIPREAITGHRSLSSFSVEARMAWMNGRSTTKPEDKAYSLLGIFGTSMPLVYGEGERKAFTRLTEEIAEDKRRRKRKKKDRGSKQAGSHHHRVTRRGGPSLNETRGAPYTALFIACSVNINYSHGN